MTTVEALLARFPYMFNEEVSSTCYVRGWAPTLIDLCEKIDALLEGQHHVFRWLVLGEAGGKPRFDYWLAGRARYVEDIFDERGKPSVVSLTIPGQPLIDQIDDIVCAARQRLGVTCMVCGKKAQTILREGRHITVCEVHAPEKLNGASESGLSGLIREAIEGS